MPKEIFSCKSHWKPFLLFGDQSGVEIIYFPGCSFAQVADLAVIPGVFAGGTTISVDDMVVVSFVMKAHIVDAVRVPILHLN